MNHKEVREVYNASVDKAFEDMANIVMQTVADYWGVTIDDIKHSVRDKGVIIMRHETQYLMKKLIPKIPLACVGRFTGNGKPKDHATVLHAFRKVSRELEATTMKGRPAYPDLHERIDDLTMRIKCNFIFQ